MRIGPAVGSAIEQHQLSRLAKGRNLKRFFIVAGAILCAAFGWPLLGQSGALLAGCGGGIVGWAIAKRAVFSALRGAVIGVVFALIVGPGADHLVNGVPFGEKIRSAVVVGGLVGGLLGVRNHRTIGPRNRVSGRETATSSASSGGPPDQCDGVA